MIHNHSKLHHDRINNNVKNPRWPPRIIENRESEKYRDFKKREAGGRETLVMPRSGYRRQ